MTINLTDPQAPVTDEELDQLIWGLERYGLYPRQLAALKELREVRRTKGEPVAYADPRALSNFEARSATREWMWARSDSGLIPLYAVQAIPDGWKLVPEEPTYEMLEAGDAQFGTYDVYRRMIEAVPKEVG
jgi:hypothetical protein